MTIWIMQEFDRKGWAVYQFRLQGCKHNETPTDKKISPDGEPPRGTYVHPVFLKGRKEGQTGYILTLNIPLCCDSCFM